MLTDQGDGKYNELNFLCMTPFEVFRITRSNDKHLAETLLRNILVV